jgi:FHA domain
MGGWNAVIDVSNVCWDARLPPEGHRRPIWSRLQLVMQAWRRQHGRDVRFHLVADDSLVHSLDDLREHGRLETSGRLTVVPVADVEILSLARDRDVHIITRDHFVDYRCEHPWIETSPRRFHRWETKEGTVRIVPLGIVPRSEQDISRVGEFKELKRHQLDPKNPRYRSILQTRWQCANPLCREAAHWQGQLLVLPVVTIRGEPRCPTCSGELTDLGPRTRIHEIVVAESGSGDEIMRFPLEADSPVIVGRGGSLKGGVDLQAYGTSSSGSAVDTVSRRHVVLRVEEPRPDARRLVVADLGSRNGTTARHPSSSGLGKPKRVLPGKETVVVDGGQILLGDTVLLRFSGKRYLTGGRPRLVYPPRLADADSAPPTVYRPV